MTIVAYRKPDCTVCQQQPAVIAEVNAAVWDGRDPASENRMRGYRRVGCTILAAHGVTVDERTIARHAEHVEVSHREPSEVSPQRRNEVPLYPTDFEGVSAKLAHLGMMAAEELENRIVSGAEIEAKELAQVAALGLKSVQGVKAAQQRDQALAAKSTHGGDDPRIAAIFVMAGGFEPERSEHEAINVTPLGEMRQLLAAERAAARDRQ